MRIRWNKLGLNHQEIKDNIGGLTHRKGTVTSVYFCPECGTEIYGEWHYTLFYNPQNQSGIMIKKAVDDSIAEYKNLQREAEVFAELEQCPVCTGNLIRDTGFFIQNDLNMDEMQFFTNPICRNSMKPVGTKAAYLSGLDNICSFLRNARAGIEENKALVNLSVLNKHYDMPISVTVNQSETDMIKSDSKKLQEYLLKIINIEKNIHSIKQRLFFLFSLTYKVNQEAKFAQYYPLMVEREKTSSKIIELEEELQRRSNEIIELQKRRECLRTSSIIPPFVPMPNEPVKPTKPVYATANLFNRKKIAAENEAKTEKYNAEVTLYNQALSEYHTLLDAAKKQQEELYEHAVKEREKELLALESNIAEKEASLEKFKIEIDEQKVVLEKNTLNLQDDSEHPAVQLKNYLDKEIATATGLIEILFKQKNQFYATGVVFGKYHDLAAVTTFYEYLLSGRCESLDGVNGCYNLYESELRANIIINKLDAIGDSLEQIKGNQYMLYSQLSQINIELSSLNSTTTAMMNDIRSTAEIFLENSAIIEHNSAVIAHNSAVSAYYAKLNAEIASSDRYISMICW